MLTIVATPIGNLKDITLRALDTLQQVDGVICEDSRVTGNLLHHFQIKKPLLILNDFNEEREVPKLIQKLKDGENLALVSDAGTPLISDPGFKLVRSCLENSIEVDSLPGPSSLILALTLSALPPDKFFFLGYLPEKQGKRIELLKKISSIYLILKTTFIVFVSPHKIEKTLQDFSETFGDIPITLAKELTKIHQTITSKKISELLADFKKQTPKGEYVVLFRLD